MRENGAESQSRHNHSINTLYLYKKFTIITQLFKKIYHANGHESNEYVLLIKQIEEYRKTIKQSTYKKTQDTIRRF